MMEYVFPDFSALFSLLKVLNISLTVFSGAVLKLLINNYSNQEQYD